MRRTVLIARLLIVFKLLVCAVERTWPRHPFRTRILNRWVGNAGMLAADFALVGLILAPGGPIGMAAYCSQNEIGLLHQVRAPLPLEVVAGFLVIDLAMWLQHWIQHQVGFLWRSHRVHHTDLDLDFSTALRFHPFEAIFAILFRILTVAAFGVPLLGALLFEVVLDVSSTVVHSNLPIPVRVDALVRRLLVTPEMHRLHHGVGPTMERNYGSILSVWDRLFHRYQDPDPGGPSVDLGLPEHRDAAALNVFALLLFPFRPNPRRQGEAGSAPAR